METEENILQRSPRKHIQITQQAASKAESQQPAQLSNQSSTQESATKPQYVQGLPVWNLLPPRGVVRRYHK